MSNIFFTADLHFNHAKVIQFESTIRNFESIEEHDEALIRNWNSVVRPRDKVWVLGDVFLGKDEEHFFDIMRKLHGSKSLILGNHDTFPIETYAKAFDSIHGVWPKYGFVMSHVPLHPDSVERWNWNVHGHLHSKKVKYPWKQYVLYDDGREDITLPDPHYYCVSVEHHNLAPVSLDTIRKAIHQT